VAVNSDNLISGHGIRYSLNDDVYAPEGARWKDLSNHIARPLYDAWVSLFIKFLPRSFWFARLSSVATGLISLVLFFVLGRRLKGEAFGLLLTGLALLHPNLWIASCVINEQIALCLSGLLLLCIYATQEIRGGWWHFGIGALSAIPCLVHQNAIILFSALFAFHWALHGNRLRWIHLLLLASGFLAGLIFCLLPVDVGRFYLFQKSFYWQLATPPILSGSLNPWTYLSNIGRLFSSPSTFYFSGYEHFRGGWIASVQWGWAAYAAVTAAGLGTLLIRDPSSGESRLARGLLAGGLISIVATGLLIKRQEALYTLIFLPFFIPLAGLSIYELWRIPRFRARLGLASGSVMVGISMFCFGRFVSAYVRESIPNDEIARRVKILIGPDTHRIMAPNVLWFDFDRENFRDVSALVTSRYFTGGEFHPKEWLAPWRPDVLVVDAGVANVLKKYGSPLEALRNALGIPVKFVGVVETNGAYGNWGVFRLTWEKEVKSPK